MLYFNRSRQPVSACLQQVAAEMEAARSQQQRELVSILTPYLRELHPYAGGLELAHRLQIEALQKLRRPGCWAADVAPQTVEQIQQAHRDLRANGQRLAEQQQARTDSIDHTSRQLRREAIRRGQITEAEAQSLGYQADLDAVRQQQRQSQF